MPQGNESLSFLPARGSAFYARQDRCLEASHERRQCADDVTNLNTLNGWELQRHLVERRPTYFPLCRVARCRTKALRAVIVSERRKEPGSLNKTPLRLATRLLVVDDDMELCSMLRDYLQESGFSVDFEAD